jgi:tetratricopeptide (TPR) repeat protein
MDREAAFKSFIEQRPEDPFPRYGLAMEYRNRGRLEAAQEQFDALVERFPEYLATYLMAGNNLVDLGRKEAAAAMYRTGIAMCTRAGEGHTRGELEAALSDLDQAD